MTSKSYVSMEQHRCRFCGKTFDTGVVLLDRRLVFSMERSTVTGWGLCPEHQAKVDEGYILLIGATSAGPNGTLTGENAMLTRDAYEMLFDAPIPAGGITLCEPQVIEQLKELM